MNNVKSNSADGEKKIVKEISIFGMLSTTYQHQTLKKKCTNTYKYYYTLFGQLISNVMKIFEL